MFGKHPLSNYEGTSPIKDLLRDVKKGEAYKNREQEKEEVQRKCQEIYVPPGIISVEETALRKVSTIEKEIKNVVPSDNIFKRQKVEQRIFGGMKNFTTIQKNVPAAALAPSVVKKGAKVVLEPEVG
jgi:hypothetical protein